MPRGPEATGQQLEPDRAVLARRVAGPGDPAAGMCGAGTPAMPPSHGATTVPELGKWAVPATAVRQASGHEDGKEIITESEPVVMPGAKLELSGTLKVFEGDCQP